MLSKKIRYKAFSYLASLVMLLNVILPAMIPIQVVAQEALENAEQTMSIDAVKEDWKGIDPIEPSVEEFDESLIGNLHLRNDDEFLYFWVDANNIENWGDEDHYLNLVLQINGEDSGNSGNPLGSNFDYSGMNNKPQYHLSLRIKQDNEIQRVSLAKANAEDFETILNSENMNGAEFSVDRQVGFEGKIPLKHLNLKNDDQLSAHVVLSGNEDYHGAFDVIPKVEGNNVNQDTSDGNELDTQSEYLEPYTVVLSENSEDETVVPEEGTDTEDNETEEPTEEETDYSELPAIEDGHFRLHFEKILHETPSQNGLWIWEDVATPSSNWPNDAISFGEAYETDYGYAIDVPLAENPEKIGFLINSLEGAGKL